MKHTNPEKKEKIIRLRRRRSARVTIRNGIRSGLITRVKIEHRGVIYINCPEHLSLDHNFDDTIAFFVKIKELALHIKTLKNERQSAFTSFSIGLGQLQHLSFRAAVVLAAELERLRRITGSYLRYSGSIADDNEAITLLRQMGSFELFVAPNARESSPEILKLAPMGHRTAIPLLSGIKCGANRTFDEFETSVKRICSTYKPFKGEYEGMVEAMLNVVNHAYISDITLRYPIADKRWWAAAAHDVNLNQLKIIVYDQGHGIAKTLPSGDTKEWFIGMTRKSVNSSFSEATLLRKALEYRRSRTGVEGRGKGFRDIEKPAKVQDGARLRICSGLAEVTQTHGHATTYKELPAHIGGTLIEWMFPIGSTEGNTREVT